MAIHSYSRPWLHAQTGLDGILSEVAMPKWVSAGSCWQLQQIGLVVPAALCKDTSNCKDHDHGHFYLVGNPCLPGQWLWTPIHITAGVVQKLTTVYADQPCWTGKRKPRIHDCSICEGQSPTLGQVASGVLFCHEYHLGWEHGVYPNRSGIGEKENQRSNGVDVIPCHPVPSVLTYVLTPVLRTHSLVLLYRLNCTQLLYLILLTCRTHICEWNVSVILYQDRNWWTLYFPVGVEAGFPSRKCEKLAKPFFFCVCTV